MEDFFVCFLECPNFRSFVELLFNKIVFIYIPSSSGMESSESESVPLSCFSTWGAQHSSFMLRTSVFSGILNGFYYCKEPKFFLIIQTELVSRFIITQAISSTYTTHTLLVLWGLILESSSVWLKSPKISAKSLP